MNELSWKEKIRAWAYEKAREKKAEAWLSGLSFIESIFFPIPPDVLLVAIVIARKGIEWLYLATLTALWSVLGGIVGYFLGFFLYDSVGAFLITLSGKEEAFFALAESFQKNTFWTIFIAGFTPIPYKVFTVAGGFFGGHIISFILASLISRFLRFALVAYVTKVFGEEIANFIFRYTNAILLLLGGAVLLWIFL